MGRWARSMAALSAAGLAALGLATPGAAAAAQPASRAADAGSGSWIVRGASSGAAADAVVRAGGTVEAALPIIDGVAAVLSPGEATRLSADGRVIVSPDVTVHVTGAGFGGPGDAPGPAAPQLAAMGLGAAWSRDGGSGVGVGLVDTGVSPSPGLARARIVRGPDLSGDHNPNDTYGHGTFMAGLIVGDGSGGPEAAPGVAPGATLVSVKVAAGDGTTSLSRVIAGIGWVVTHRDDYRVRVLLLALGADMASSPEANPLDAATEAAWAAGITVVTAAGNEGGAGVTSPGDDPWVVTAGAASSPAVAAPWSGLAAGKPDIYAPGVSVVSVRDAGSTIDREHPSARVAGGYFRGSGTSMAAALVAGAAALLAHDHPAATPDDIKGALVAGAGTPLTGHAGMIDVAASDAAAPNSAWWQHHPIAFNGLGLGLATAMPWASASWTSASWTSASWASASWTSASWTSASWASASWTSASWTSASWTSASWTDRSWP